MGLVLILETNLSIAMTSYTEWWDGLSLPLKIYWGLAIPFTLFFLLQLVLSLFGGEHAPDDVPDVEVEHDAGFGSQFFTIKNFVAFFTIFSWTGIVCTTSGYSVLATLMISLGAGLAMMTLMAFIFYSLSKASHDGTMKIAKALGGVGQVYLPIMKRRSAMGQVQIKVDGALRTLDALTDDDDDIPTGKMVTVKQIINNTILLVTAK
jgi:hypothetical protein